MDANTRREGIEILATAIAAIAEDVLEAAVVQRATLNDYALAAERIGLACADAEVLAGAIAVLARRPKRLR